MGSHGGGSLNPALKAPHQPSPMSFYSPSQSLAPLHVCTRVCKPIHNSANRTCGVIWGGGPTTQPYNPPPNLHPHPFIPPHNPLCPCTFAHARASPYRTLEREPEWGHMGGSHNPALHPPSHSPHIPLFPPPQSFAPLHVCTRVCKAIQNTGKTT